MYATQCKEGWEEEAQRGFKVWGRALEQFLEGSCAQTSLRITVMYPTAVRWQRNRPHARRKTGSFCGRRRSARTKVRRSAAAL
eukprot:SAG11_NODE_16243_length_553_cov_1.136564_1_plen_82_part_10